MVFIFLLEIRVFLKGLIRGLTEYIALKLKYNQVIAVSNVTKSRLIKNSISSDKILLYIEVST